MPEIVYIVSRESVEIFLLFCLILNFYKEKQDWLKVQITYIALIASGILTIILGSFLSNFLENNTKTTIVLHCIQLIVTLKIIVTLFQRTNFKNSILAKIPSLSNLSLFLFVFFYISKEGMEIICFLGPYLQNQGQFSFLAISLACFIGICLGLGVVCLYNKFVNLRRYKINNKILNILLGYILIEILWDLYNEVSGLL